MMIKGEYTKEILAYCANELISYSKKHTVDKYDVFAYLQNNGWRVEGNNAYSSIICNDDKRDFVLTRSQEGNLALNYFHFIMSEYWNDDSIENFDENVAIYIKSYHDAICIVKDIGFEILYQEEYHVEYEGKLTLSRSLAKKENTRLIIEQNDGLEYVPIIRFVFLMP